jgi:hypothetical protein
MSEQEENIQEVLDILGSVAPAAEDAPRPASQALATLRSRNEPRRRMGRVTWPAALLLGRRYAWATLIAVLALVVAMSFPGVRAAASDFLGLFRVQKRSRVWPISGRGRVF